ncbi:DUF1501 domain-containing protein [Ideonella sp. 4Y11]|uniref:DUF1501 domain-containing protein n=1 Tax=Ideonella aquatica TaxID=2824119 RepID=A0A941BMA3_9BURK|nr:DUF1501 domain-containing protein [Ideonella aquatica]MBQ0960614.1 DUF1501 domain-containing protein [Ideonella aquatica]
MNHDDLPLNSLSRRRWLGGVAALASTMACPSLVMAGAAGPDDPRMVLVILRGGMDGLAAVPALGDPDFQSARGPMAQFGRPTLPLDQGFALHPELAKLHEAYRAGELTVVHAVAQAYRERSHFDGQQLLESGGLQPYTLRDGWLGRALKVGGLRKGLAIGNAVPLVLRGAAGVDTWAPSALPDPPTELLERLRMLYADDKELLAALTRAQSLRDDAAGGMASVDARKGGHDAFRTLAKRAAEFLSQPNGPQIAVLELGGWDSHTNAVSPTGRLAHNFSVLDAGLGQLRETLQASSAWRRTVVVAATEFGRTVATNGTQGTDHGTASAAFVLGGAVKGGRVLTDWPGLAAAQLHERRDLRPTTDLRAVFKGVLADHLRVPSQALSQQVFPDSAAIAPLRLIA